MSMFTFNTTTGSLSSSQGRSSTSSTKSNYVPSTYIAKQLQLEEEAKRQGHQLNSQNGTSTLRTDSTEHWRGPGDVLAPGYGSGPLGYQLPTQGSTASSARSQSLFDDNRNASILGAGVGIGIHGASSINNNTTTTTTSSREPGSPTSTRLYPNLHASSSPEQSSSPRSILRGGEQRQDLNKDEGTLRKSTSVRFNAAANDIGTPRPGTPSIYNQNGAGSPFFNSSSIHSSANLQSALKEPGKVDVLSHRAASTGQPQKNSSLGPALGSVSGTAQSPPTYSSPKMQNEYLSSSSMRSSSSQYQNANSGGSMSLFQFGVDGNLLRQNSKASTLLTKTSLDEDEDDKERERYMPVVLLDTPGTKGSKIEPFVDGANDKSDWESNSFQQAESSSRVAPHLIGEDAPPVETLFDVAKKEKYYSRQAPTFDKNTAPLQDTRADTTMNGASQGEASSSSFLVSSTNEGFDSIITYGFPPEATSYVLNQFRSFGMILRYESGVYGQVEAESFNWLKIHYNGAWAARNAITRHLKSVGKFIVGVHACPSFSAQKRQSSSSPDMSMDTRDDGDMSARQTIGNELTEAEAREVQAGVDTLLRMRAQSLHADVGYTQSAQNASTIARQASLYESWSQGSANALGQSQFGTSTLGGSGAGALARSSAMDQGEDDMAYILSHSLTSGGSLARSGRGRGFERNGQDEFSRSRSKDQLGQDQEPKLGGESTLGLDSKGAELSSSVGFRPLFGQSESRGLNSSGAGASQDSLLQQSTASHSAFDASRQQQLQQEALLGSRHRLSLRRPLGESTVSDSTLFASTGGVLMDSDVLAGASSTNSAPGSPFHVQKKQRLSSSLFAPSSSAPTSAPISQAQFGTGRNRASVLIDNPDLVDEWGTPLLSKMKAAGGTGAGAPGSAAANGAANAGGAGGAGTESMIASVFNMAKKRLFWG
ncbi:hypothetical protein EC957_005379 [Mortierella hygrophila]|uniref:RRM Nup35-type domain-containing protein n=1 Tax=Mortierella hygrophila TaxID=979708 RepID=A0A9P6F114_9FUNG|nr:hypothetical protein EC957_005379 [Mortierella hygrophila]